MSSNHGHGHGHGHDNAFHVFQNYMDSRRHQQQAARASAATTTAAPLRSQHNRYSDHSDMNIGNNHDHGYGYDRNSVAPGSGSNSNWPWQNNFNNNANAHHGNGIGNRGSDSSYGNGNGTGTGDGMNANATPFQPFAQPHAFGNGIDNNSNSNTFQQNRAGLQYNNPDGNGNGNPQYSQYYHNQEHQPEVLPSHSRDNRFGASHNHNQNQRPPCHANMNTWGKGSSMDSAVTSTTRQTSAVALHSQIYNGSIDQSWQHSSFGVTSQSQIQPPLPPGSPPPPSSAGFGVGIGVGIGAFPSAPLPPPPPLPPSPSYPPTSASASSKAVASKQKKSSKQHQHTHGQKNSSQSQSQSQSQSFPDSMKKLKEQIQKVKNPSPNPNNTKRQKNKRRKARKRLKNALDKSKQQEAGNDNGNGNGAAIANTNTNKNAISKEVSGTKEDVPADVDVDIDAVTTKRKGAKIVAKNCDDNASLSLQSQELDEQSDDMEISDSEDEREHKYKQDNDHNKATVNEKDTAKEESSRQSPSPDAKSDNGNVKEAPSLQSQTLNLKKQQLLMSLKKAELEKARAQLAAANLRKEGALKTRLLNKSKRKSMSKSPLQTSSTTGIATTTSTAKEDLLSPISGKPLKNYKRANIELDSTHHNMNMTMMRGNQGHRNGIGQPKPKKLKDITAFAMKSLIVVNVGILEAEPEPKSQEQLEWGTTDFKADVYAVDSQNVQQQASQADSSGASLKNADKLRLDLELAKRKLKLEELIQAKRKRLAGQKLKVESSMPNEADSKDDFVVDVKVIKGNETASDLRKRLAQMKDTINTSKEVNRELKHEAHVGDLRGMIERQRGMLEHHGDTVRSCSASLKACDEQLPREKEGIVRCKEKLDNLNQRRAATEKMIHSVTEKLMSLRRIREQNSYNAG